MHLYGIVIVLFFFFFFLLLLYIGHTIRPAKMSYGGKKARYMYMFVAMRA